MRNKNNAKEKEDAGICFSGGKIADRIFGFDFCNQYFGNTDGQLQKNILHVIGKDVEWVKREVAEQGYASIKEVYLGEYRNGSLHCYPERL